MSPRVRPRSILAWSAVFAMAACNGIWGIHDGTLLPPEASQAGQAGGESGGAPPDGGGAPAVHGGEAGESGGAGGAAAGSGGEGDGGEIAGGGVSGGAVGGTGGAAGSMSGTGGGGAPSCSGCKLNEQKSENRACGRCGTGSQSRTATCDANCTWHWSDWSVCSQCDEKPYRCCGAGKWEWCYDSDCAWTKDCAACAASSCPEC